MVVHTVLPEALESAVAGVLAEAGIAHAAHPDGRAVAAAETAAADAGAVALIGPYRSREVAEAVEVTAPRRLALLAPIATWVGVTRQSEPGCDDPADHQGTVFRMLARDMVVAERIAGDARARGLAAWVVAGDHEYGVQLDAQLRVAGLPRVDTPEAADVVVLCGLAGQPEIERAAALAPLPVVAFDGVQGARLGPGRDVLLALPFAPGEDFAGVAAARRAAQLVAQTGGDLDALRAAGPFDAHGDPVDPP
ncbi:MAG: hypothetical protein JWM73_2333, partial [Solirubrobacterales bacterium]|nr:hypothetical protein [Solirubrobacterales bacterium]